MPEIRRFFHSQPSTPRHIAEAERVARARWKYWDTKDREPLITRREAVQIAGVFGLMALISFPRSAEVIQEQLICEDGAEPLGNILKDEQAQRWISAASTAEYVLLHKDLCAKDKQKIGTHFVKNNLNILLSTNPSPMDFPSQEDTFRQFRALQKTAQKYDLDRSVFPDNLSLARRFVLSGNYVLAQAAVDDAWAEVQFSKDDRDVINLSYSVWRTLGYLMTRVDRSRYRERGIDLLVRAQNLNKEYKLKRTDAYEDLRSMLGGNEAAWRYRGLDRLSPSPWPQPR